MSTSPLGGRSGQKTDLPTVAAISVVAYIVANVVHEGLGHGRRVPAHLRLRSADPDDGVLRERYEPRERCRSALACGRRHAGKRRGGPSLLVARPAFGAAVGRPSVLLVVLDERQPAGRGGIPALLWRSGCGRLGGSRRWLADGTSAARGQRRGALRGRGVDRTPRAHDAGRYGPSRRGPSWSASDRHPVPDRQPRVHVRRAPESDRPDVRRDLRGRPLWWNFRPGVDGPVARVLVASTRARRFGPGPSQLGVDRRGGRGALRPHHASSGAA